MNILHKTTIIAAILAVICFFTGLVGPGLGFLVIAAFFGFLVECAAS